MLRKLKLIVQLLILQFTARSQVPAFDQLPFTNPLKTDIDSIVHEQARIYFKRTKAPGLVIGISQKGKRSFYSYGYADTASKKKWGPHTVFEAGSITKTFVANLLLQLDAKGILDIEKSLADYIPGGKANDSVLSKVVLKKILSHTSGLERLDMKFDKVPGYDFMQPYANYRREHLYDYLTKLKKVTPGPYVYSNLGFGILSTIAENMTGDTFEELLRKYIWTPMGMIETYISMTARHDDTATGYFYNRIAEYWKFDCLSGAGAIRSTANDMLNYLESHIKPNTDALRDAIGRITVPVYPVDKQTQVCYAWHTFEDMKHRAFWHDGGTYGFSTLAGFEPVSGNAVIFATNKLTTNESLTKFGENLLIYLMGK